METTKQKARRCSRAFLVRSAAMLGLARSGKQSLHLLFNHVLWNIAHNLIRNLAALEKQKRWDSTNSVTRWRCGVLVHIDLRHLQFTGVSSGYPVYDRCDCLAGTAPGCPKINQNWLLAFQHFLFKRCVAYFHNSQSRSQS